VKGYIESVVISGKPFQIRTSSKIAHIFEIFTYKLMGDIKVVDLATLLRMNELYLLVGTVFTDHNNFVFD